MARTEVEDKTTRILSIYTKLKAGKVLSKHQEAKKYGVAERTIQRDLDDIRCFLQSNVGKTGEIQEIVFDRQAGGYRIQTRSSGYFEAKEILTVCKVLLESRSLVKEEMLPIIRKMIRLCGDENTEKMVESLTANEMHHYIELQHGKQLLDMLWKLETAVKEQRYLAIRYKKLKEHQVVERKVKPVGVMFSEFYFYLTAFIEDIDKERAFCYPEDLNPTIYRIDRLESAEVLEERFSIPYRERFEEGVFRRRVPFMFGGKLRRVRFRYKGLSVESILDKLPTAKVLDEKDGVYTIQAEAYGQGIDMWLKSQGDYVETCDER